MERDCVWSRCAISALPAKSGATINGTPTVDHSAVVNCEHKTFICFMLVSQHHCTKKEYTT